MGKYLKELANHMMEKQRPQEVLIQRKVTGFVKWFDLKRGLRFIRCEECSFDIFVHHTSIVAEGYKLLKAKSIVEFSLHRTLKGYFAKDVTVVD